MRFVWLLPSLISSLVFAISTGHSSYLLFAASSLAIGVLLVFISRNKKIESSRIRELVSIDGRWYLGSDRVTRARVAINRRFRRELLSILRARTREPDWDSAFTALGTTHAGLPRLGITLTGLGQANCFKVLELPWQSNPHTLVIGPTGSGKTVLLMRILEDCLGIPEVQVWFFDYKSSESEVLAQAAYRAGGTLKFNSSSLASELDALWGDLFAQLHWFDKRPNLHTRVHHVVIVDELAAALEQPESRARILQLAAQGRSAGVRLICASQTTAGIPRVLLANLMNRVLVGEPDQAERLTLSSRSEAIRPENGQTGALFRASHPGWLSGKLIHPATEFFYPQKT